MPTKDLYAVLEVSSRASPEVIKASYLALIKTAHPDHGGSNPRAVALNEAYGVLSDPDKRKAYDRSRKASDGTLTIGNYVILEEIAEGGFGVTYKGRHVLNDELVCIKHCSHVSAVHDEVLIKESKSVWNLPHPGLAIMRDLQRFEDGSLALIMSYVPGPTLEQVVEKVGCIDPESCGWITERILNTLLYLHHHAVIHGDLKPQNIIVQQDTHSVVLVDFGFAQSKPVSSTKGIGYTEQFSPPEQVALKPLLPASDYYSLGKVMTYALGGGIEAVKKSRVPTSVPEPMCDFIRRVTQKNILDRPQEDEDLFDQFREVRKRSFGRARSDMKPIPGL